MLGSVLGVKCMSQNSKKKNAIEFEVCIPTENSLCSPNFPRVDAVEIFRQHHFFLQTNSVRRWWVLQKIHRFVQESQGRWFFLCGVLPLLERFDLYENQECDVGQEKKLNEKWNTLWKGVEQRLSWTSKKISNPRFLTFLFEKQEEHCVSMGYWKNINTCAIACPVALSGCEHWSWRSDHLVTLSLQKKNNFNSPLQPPKSVQHRFYSLIPIFWSECPEVWKCGLISPAQGACYSRGFGDALRAPVPQKKIGQVFSIISCNKEISRVHPLKNINSKISCAHRTYLLPPGNCQLTSQIVQR